MAYIGDYSTDYQYIDGVEDVTFTPQTGVYVESVKAIRGTLTRREIALGGIVGLDPQDVVFILWASTLSGNEPQQADTITDASGVVFNILDAAKTPSGDQYRCTCRKQQ